MGYLAISLLMMGMASGVLAGESPVYRAVAETLEVSNGFQAGSWTKKAFCRVGYAVGFTIKLQEPLGDEDDSAVTGIAIKCLAPALRIFKSSGQSSVGDWKMDDVQDCSGTGMYLQRFSLKVYGSDYSDGRDDTAVNNVRFECGPKEEGIYKRDAEDENRAERGARGGEVLEIDGGPDGAWSSWTAKCPKYTAICGLQTKVAPYSTEENADNVGVTDVKFFCCAFTSS